MAIESIGKAAKAAAPAEGASKSKTQAVAPPGGSELPVGGNGVPSAPVAPVDISRAISNLNRFLQDSRRDILFQMDETSGRTVITIVNPSTGEIVRQIPPEEVLNAARTLKDAGILLSATA